QMRIAARATRLRASHAIAGVGLFADVLAVGGGEEAWPSGSRIKLCFRAKQQCATADAVVGSVVVFIPVLAGEGALGATGAGYLILLRSELLPPLGVRLRDLFSGDLFPGDLVADLFGHLFSPENRMRNGRESCNCFVHQPHRISQASVYLPHKRSDRVAGLWAS